MDRKALMKALRDDPELGVRADDRDGADDPADQQGRVRLAPGSLSRVNVEYYEPDDEQKLDRRHRSLGRPRGHRSRRTTPSCARRSRTRSGARPSSSTIASLRRLGTHGAVDRSNRATSSGSAPCARYRATDESGLGGAVRPGTMVGGYDPAANYRPFEEQVERLDARGRS